MMFRSQTSALSENGLLSPLLNDEIIIKAVVAIDSCFKGVDHYSRA